MQSLSRLLSSPALFLCSFALAQSFWSLLSAEAQCSEQYELSSVWEQVVGSRAWGGCTAALPSLWCSPAKPRAVPLLADVHGPNLLHGSSPHTYLLLSIKFPLYFAPLIGYKAPDRKKKKKKKERYSEGWTNGNQLIFNKRILCSCAWQRWKTWLAVCRAAPHFWRKVQRATWARIQSFWHLWAIHRGMSLGLRWRPLIKQDAQPCEPPRCVQWQEGGHSSASASTPGL